MKIALIGGTGFVGRHLACGLVDDDHDVTIYSRNPEKHRGHPWPPGTRLAHLQPFDQHALTSAIAGFDTVINLSGILHQTKKPGKTFSDVHAQLPKQLAEVSSGEKSVRHVIQLSALNSANGISSYLRSKAEGEMALKARAAQGHYRLSIIQPSVIFGRDDSFFNRFASIIRLAPGIVPLACANARLSPVWVEDVCSAIRMMVNKPPEKVTHIECCGPREYTLSDIVRLTGNTIGKPVKVLPLPDIIARIQGMIFDHLPIKLFTTDNYLSLQTDSCCQKNSLVELGIEPASVEAILPTYMGKLQRSRVYQTYRKT